MVKKKRQRKNCPACLYLSPMAGSCNKNPERDTYSIYTLPAEPKEREWCPDMKKRKK